ncbi:MAG: DUF4040 domain-containing protein [Actinobacteria bacterium]|nr:DUF4040 domain-containing protein [Actinomycetota bacterium]
MQRRHLHLSLWHGFTLPLLLTACVIFGGSALVVGRVGVNRMLVRGASPVTGQRAYSALLKGTLRLADRVTAVVQPGSLPLYLGVTLTVIAIVPGVALLGMPFPDLPPLTTGPGDWAAAALIVAGGIAATVVQERIAAVLCLSAVGYGMGLVFILQGAPDLALTQVCIDTLGAVVFVLVLRKLPTASATAPPVRGTGCAWPCRPPWASRCSCSSSPPSGCAPRRPYRTSSSPAPSATAAGETWSTS